MSSWFETPAYVAPEQATGQPAVPASDIYALGAIVYEMLTGEPPFSATDSEQLLAALLRETPPPPTERNPALPAGIDDVVMQALAKTPTDRYTTAADFISESDARSRDRRACSAGGWASRRSSSRQPPSGWRAARR